VIAYAKASDIDNRGRLLIDGEPAPLDSVGDELASLVPGAKASAIAACLRELHELDILIVDDRGAYCFRRWEERNGSQRPSDSREAVRDRVRRYRERKPVGNEPGNGVTRTITDDGNAARAVEYTEQTELPEQQHQLAAAGEGVREIALALTVAANKGIAAKWGEQPNPLRFSHPGAADLAAAVIDTAIPLAFAESAVFSACGESRLERPPRSLAYFVEVVRSAWMDEQARRATALGGTPTVIPLRPSRDPGAVFDRLLETERANRANRASAVGDP